MDTSKIIKGVVNSGRYTVTAPIVKEDYGLYLQIEGVELPPTYQVDFSNNENNGTSVTMIGNSDGVLIPREFIDTGKDVFAFLYHVGIDYGKTVYKFRIPNKLRPDRTDDTPTPEEQSVIDQAIGALNDAVAQTAQDVIDAAASASAASQSESNAHDSELAAQGYAQDASGYASDAQGYANTASQKATAAGNSADQAAQIKTDIEGYVSTAQGYAQTATDKAAQASQSATNASNSATTASTKAGEASASATTASTKAGEASASATTASNKAIEASGYASTASQKASDASDSASAALGYKTAAQTAQGLAESARDSAVQAKTDAESAKADAESARDEAQQAVASISGALADKAPAITDTASGSITSFPDGADDIPLKSLVVNIDPVQDLHGQDAPYPAGGGKNKINAPDVTLSSAGYIYNNSLALPAGTYTVSLVWSGSGTPSASFAILDVDGNNLVGGSHNFPYTFTISSDSVSARLYAAATGTYSQIQIEEGSTATAYAPYENICPISGWTQIDVSHSDADMTNPTTLTIQLGQTVYGGKLDVLSGVMRVEMAQLILDGTQPISVANWKPQQNSVGWLYPYSLTNNIIGTGTVIQNIKCDKLPTAKFNELQTINSNGIALSNAATYGIAVMYADVSLTTKNAINTFLTQNPLQVVYELATPITIQLTPNQINSLLGVNNIWADSGDTEAVYRADTKLFIERLTAPDSADMIADSNITSGQYFMVGNSLYLATSNIASGGQVIVGTNAIRKSLSEALNEINA